MSDNDTDMQAVLNEIKFGAKYRGGPKGFQKRCVLMEKVEAFPEPQRSAIKVAMDDTEIPHPQLLAYINGVYPDSQVSLTSVQRHRSKHGCHICPATKKDDA